MRVLFASTSGTGHITPLLPFAEAFRRRGDEVLLVIPPGLEITAQEAGHAYQLGGRPPADEVDAIRHRFDGGSHALQAELIDRELFGRLCTAAMLPAMTDACLDWQPDLVLREPCEYSSAITATRMGIPHAQVAISPAEVEASAVDIVTPELTPYDARLPQRLRAAPYLTRFPASLDPSPFAKTHRFRENNGKTGERLPDWWRGSRAPLVYMSFGTVTGDLAAAPAVYRAALDAVSGLDARVLLTVGRKFDPRALGPVPDTVHMTDWVSHADVLAEAAVVVCHGGSGTTFGTLAAGVPLVVAPMFADQPTNARLVERAGAGITVPTADGAAAPDPRLIAAALARVLAEPGYRAAARRVAEEMRGAPSIDTLIDDLLGNDQSTEVGRTV
ncbi:MAG TPA: glycosyltransferase [Pseudonocardiaceae bacterium]|jgi:UDP:flavonoid glycosyltransferase YjiC (YdhE family)|nr:glycosyltransferase [Pseudonocardiaceae bacterium]